MMYYSLTTIPRNGLVIQEFINNNWKASHAINIYGYSKAKRYWHSHQDDLKEFSKKHPTIVFRLAAENNPSLTDGWVKYFQNGKVQFCKVRLVVEDFDPNKLT